MREHEILILGGGTGGVTVAARLLRARRGLDVAIVEPSTDHGYQPLWTLVGAGVATVEETRRDQASVVPKGATWIRDRVVAIDPDARRVTLAGGDEVGYGQLVVALGIELAWDAVDGLREAIGRDGVVSNYLPRHAEATWRALDAFEGGTMVFTNPAGQVKCGGAPQKILYLAEDLVRLDDPDRRRVRIAYDLLHVTPPMRAPAPVRRSPLAAADGPHAGYAEVDVQTLQHVRYPDVFALGDAAALPTAKTGAAIRKQAPVLVERLLAHRDGREGTSAYGGYSSCPLVTGYGRLVLAEFEYGDVYKPTFPVDSTRERWDMYMLKRHLLPRMYGYGMLRGLA